MRAYGRVAYQHTLDRFALVRFDELLAQGVESTEAAHRAYRETYDEAEHHYRRRVDTRLHPAVTAVHVVLIVCTLGLWLPVFLLHLVLLHLARDWRHGTRR